MEDVDDAELEQSESATAKTLRKEDVFDIDGANGHTSVRTPCRSYSTGNRSELRSRSLIVGCQRLWYSERGHRKPHNQSPRENRCSPRHGICHVRFAHPVNSQLTKTSSLHSWNALIFYLYTGEVAFNILRSQANVSLPANTKVSTTQSKAARPPACSPKSMYRLADMVRPHLRP